MPNLIQNVFDKKAVPQNLFGVLGHRLLYFRTYETNIVEMLFKMVFGIYIAYHYVNVGEGAEAVRGIVIYFAPVAEKNSFFGVFHHNFPR